MPIVFRFVAYTFCVLLVTGSLPVVVAHLGIGFFRENGPLEWLQLGVILAAGAVLVVASLLASASRSLIILLACAVALAGVRELDALLDDAVPWLGWKVGFLIVPYALISVYLHRQTLTPQLTEFVSTRAFAILWSGFLLAVPIAQLVGHGPFLKLAMGGNYVHEYKQMIEEILELTGYVLLIIGSIELMVELGPARQREKSVVTVRRTAKRRPAQIAARAIRADAISFLDVRRSLLRRLYGAGASMPSALKRKGKRG